MRKIAHISTFGCQMNENDSERIAGILNTMGYSLCDDPEEADIVVFNTCCVRDSAEQKIYGKLGALKGLKNKNPDMIIVLSGCMASNKNSVEQVRKKYKHVDIIISAKNLHMLPGLIEEAKHGSDAHEILISNTECDAVEEGVPVMRKDKYRAYVTIMYGCNNFCTYCIVPYVRGREKSRNIDNIIKEIEDLTRSGYKEITLLGQNINSYGKDLKMSNFPLLLEKINQIDNIGRIRFMTSHPKDLTDDLLKAMAEYDCMCEHLHLPIQSGSTEILKKMNRRYTKEDYLNLVKKAKATVPNLAITTDIIVGFPGETEEDFHETLDVIKKVRFDMAFTFLYSTRAGTPAAKMENQVEPDVVKKRFAQLVDLQNKISLELNRELIGTEAEILVEGSSKSDASVYTGRTRTNKIVNIKPKLDQGNCSSVLDDLTGKLVMVKIEDAKTWHLEGSLV